jgi:cytoplasmic iron level regulating protein YaaA (DUF328/UPF0246 family)
MYIIISPAKKQKSAIYPNVATSDYLFNDKVYGLVKILQSKSVDEIQNLMQVSKNIADLNFQRYKNFSSAEGHPAAFLFQGDVYKKLATFNWTKNDCEYSQIHLGILSGLYGWLRPMDKIMPYRLEMKTRLVNQFGADLYSFWGDEVSLAIKKHMQDNNIETIVNLASNEYFKVINKNILPSIINIEFKEQGPNGLRIVAVNAKRARGLMANYMIINKIKSADCLKNFDLDGYGFKQDLSLEDRLVFVKN